MILILTTTEKLLFFSNFIKTIKKLKFSTEIDTNFYKINGVGSVKAAQN